MKKWILKNTKADLNELSKALNVDKLLCKIASNRGINSIDKLQDFLSPEPQSFHSPLKLADMERATELVLEAIEAEKKIRIVGDYDQDGISSTVILYKGLKKLGARVDYDIPERSLDGYGINERIVKLAGDEAVDMIITCDNGIAAVEPIALAKELGLKVIITDHHDLPQSLPGADAILNPKRKDCNYPFKSLCGAGVAFKFIQALYQRLGLSEIELEQYYEFVAMATVCDVVDLIEENRIFVVEGLRRIGETQNIGLRALLSQTKLSEKQIGSYHIGFILGPCINASGRLETAKTAIELFLTEDKAEATEKAKTLYELNEERKQLTQAGIETLVNRIELKGLSEDRVLVLYEPGIHESIAGIIAGRIKEKYNRPAIVLTNSKHEEIKKGSGRSIEEYNMFEELSKLDELFERFGGHPMAAGLSLKYENIEALRTGLNRNTVLSEEDLTPKLYLDAAIPIEYMSFEIIGELKRLEPFGKGNTKPVFGDRNIDIRGIKILGQGYRIMKFNMSKAQNEQIEGIYFGDLEELEAYLRTKFGDLEFEKALLGKPNSIQLDLAYYPSINEFNGKTSIQIVIQDYR